MTAHLHAPATLPPEKEPPLDSKLGGPQSQFRCCGEEKYLLPLPGIKPDSPVIIVTPAPGTLAAVDIDWQ